MVNSVRAIPFPAFGNAFPNVARRSNKRAEVDGRPRGFRSRTKTVACLIRLCCHTPKCVAHVSPKQHFCVLIYRNPRYTIPGCDR